MYQAEYSEKVLEYLTTAKKENDKISEVLQKLEDNPLSIAKLTGYPAIGKYYIESDEKHAILFNLDQENEVIQFKSVRRLSWLENLIQKRYE